MTSTSSGLTMLTTGVSQYLHPDYLQPLPTTLDAKKSPLALLAQTCSAIGKDTSPSKPIIPPLEKKDANNEKSSEKSFENSEASKRPSSHGNKESSGRDSKPGFRTFPPKEIPPLVPISASSTEKTSSIPGSEPKSSSPSGPVGASVPSSCPSSSSRPLSAGGHHASSQRSSSRSSTGKSEGEPHHSHQQQPPHGSSHSSSSSSGSSHSHHPHHHHRSRDSPASTSSSHANAPSPSYTKPSSSGSTPVTPSTLPNSSASSSSSSAIKPSVTHPSMLGGLPPAAHLFPNPLALMGHGLDPSSPGFHSALAAAHSSLSSYSSAAAAAQSSALKAAAANAPGGISPYVTYAQVRTPSGATTLVPVCRDPFCTYCQQTLQNSHLAANCTAPGCAQCAHEKSLASLSALSLQGAAAAGSSMLLPPFSSSGSLSSSMSALSSLHSLYPHSALAAARQGLPYACSWISGNDYCGKRFGTSEELLQHLRSHTSSLDVSSIAASYAGLGLPSALAAYPHLAAPAPLSPNSLRRNYPTSLSPVGSLLGASRYHPYKSPLSGVGATPPTPQNFPPVGPYYSPYTLYGQRLGAAVVP